MSLCNRYEVEMGLLVSKHGTNEISPEAWYNGGRTLFRELIF